MSHRDSLVLSSSTQDRNELRRQVSATMDAIMASYDDESAFSGMNPFELRRRIQAIDVLPDSGLGFDDTLTTVAREVLPHMLRPSRWLMASSACSRFSNSMKAKPLCLLEMT